MTTRYHCRCRHCRTRCVLPQSPAEMKRLPRCRVCGRRNYHVDRWMNARDTACTVCTCGGSGAYVNARGVAWPHRRGSLFCHWRPDGSGRYPGDPDFQHPEMYR